MKKKCVLVIGPYGPSLLSFRGALMKSMAESGHQVHAAAPGITDEVKLALETFGVMTHELPLNRASSNLLIEMRTIFCLWKIVRSARPDVILAYAPKPIMYGLPVGFLAGCPDRYGMITGLGYAFTPGSGLKRKALRLASKLLYKIAFACASTLIFQNPDDREEMLLQTVANRKQYDRSVIVNGSGVDIEHYSNQPLPSLPLRFFMACRLLADKGVREYVQVATKVRQNMPDIQFILAGPLDSNHSSISKMELEEWVANGTIQYVGSLPDIISELALCHVFVLPSYREGTPRSVLEALSTGRPIITTNAPGCRETVIDGENGFLVSVANASELQIAVMRFVEQPSLLKDMAIKSRILAETKYDVRKINEFLMNTLMLN